VLRWAAIVLVVVAGGSVLALALGRRHRERKDARARQALVQAGPHVRVIAARRAPEVTTLELQGEARSYLDTVLYAKLAGFAREVRADKGDRVRAGQVVARVESPETDRQVLAARANAANLVDVARRSRWLASQQLIATQDAEQAVATAQVAVESERQVRAVRAYELLRAPFDGIVTARYVDPGALLQATTPVLSIARPDRLRVFCYVDQRSAGQVRVGDRAEVRFPEVKQPRPGAVSRIAGALDPRTRMLLVEIDEENPGTLLAGGFVDVRLTVRQPPAVEVPSQALVTRGAQTLVPVIDEQDRVRFRKVSVVGDDGKTLRIDAGLEAAERVAVGLGETVAEGAKVQPIAE
jgi:RND family efflux transporter MFP subunit